MLNIVLVHPKIPQNTGNIIRLAVNAGAQLHLIRPFGFIWNEKTLKRAAMDYKDLAHVSLWNNLDDFLAQHSGRIFCIETCGHQSIYQAMFQENDALLFGSEDDGLSPAIYEKYPCLIIPQKGGRSINLSNAVAITTYEAMRQLDEW